MSKELPFRSQIVAYLCFWIVWFAAITCVHWKMNHNDKMRVVFANPDAVITLILIAFPLTISASGLALLARRPNWPELNTMDRFGVAAVTALTFISMLIVVFGGYSEYMAFYHPVRE